jgi:hypothetical protein
MTPLRPSPDDGQLIRRQTRRQRQKGRWRTARVKSVRRVHAERDSTGIRHVFGCREQSSQGHMSVHISKKQKRNRNRRGDGQLTLTDSDCGQPMLETQQISFHSCRWQPTPAPWSNHQPRAGCDASAAYRPQTLMQTTSRRLRCHAAHGCPGSLLPGLRRLLQQVFMPSIL